MTNRVKAFFINYKREIIFASITLLFLIIGVLTRFPERIEAFPYYYLSIARDTFDGHRILSSFDFSSVFVFGLLYRIDFRNFVGVSTAFLNTVLCFLYLSLMGILWLKLKNYSYFYYILTSALITMLVFNRCHVIVSFNSLVLPIALTIICLLYLCFKLGAYLNNIKFRNISLIVLTFFSILFASIPLFIVFGLFLALEIIKAIKNKNIEKDSIILIACSAAFCLYYLAMLLLSYRYFSFNDGRRAYNFIPYFISNFVTSMVGPIRYTRVFATEAFIVTVGVIVVLLVCGGLTYLTIRNKKFPEIGYVFAFIVFLNIIYTLLCLGNQFLAGSSFAALSIGTILVLIVVVIECAKLITQKFVKKENSDFVFLITNFCLSLGIFISLFGYGYDDDWVTRYSSFAAVVKEDVSMSPENYSFAGLGHDRTEDFCRFLYKNNLGEYANFKLTSQVQTTGFLWGTNVEMPIPFDISYHYWFPKLTHIFLNSEEGTTFIFKCEIEEDQLGTNCTIHIDGELVYNDAINDTSFEFKYEGLNKNEAYGIRVEISNPHEDETPYGFKMYQMEIK